MGSEFTFYDYIDADRGGVNVIKRWLNGDGKPAQVHFTQLIENLEASAPAGGKDSLWKYPFVRPMKNEWRGFVELRKEAGNVQYRIIGQIRNRDVCLVAYAVHKDQRFPTDVSPNTASIRVTQMVNNPTRYRREHEHD